MALRKDGVKALPDMPLAIVGGNDDADHVT